MQPRSETALCCLNDFCASYCSSSHMAYIPSISFCCRIAMGILALGHKKRVKGWDRPKRLHCFLLSLGVPGHDKQSFPICASPYMLDSASRVASHCGQRGRTRSGGLQIWAVCVNG